MGHITSVTTSGLSYSGGIFYINVYVDSEAYNLAAYIRSGSWFDFQSRTPEYRSSGGYYRYTCTAASTAGGSRPAEVIFTFYASASDTQGEDYLFSFEQQGYLTGVLWGFEVRPFMLSTARSTAQWQVYATELHADGSSTAIDPSHISVSCEDTWVTIAVSGYTVTEPYSVFGTATLSASSSPRYTVLKASYSDYVFYRLLYQEPQSFDVLAVQGWLKLGTATITRVDVYEHSEVETPVAASQDPISLLLGWFVDGTEVRSVGIVNTTIDALLGGGLILGVGGVGSGISSLGVSALQSYSAADLFAGVAATATDAESALSQNVVSGVNVLLRGTSIQGNLRHITDPTQLIVSATSPLSFGESGGTLAITFKGTSDITYTSEEVQEEYVPLLVGTPSVSWLQVSAALAGGLGPTTGAAPTPNTATLHAAINTGDARTVDLVPNTAYSDGSTNVPFIVPQYTDGELNTRRLLVSQSAGMPDFIYSNLTCTGLYSSIPASGGVSTLSLTVTVTRSVAGGSPAVFPLLKGEYTVTSISFTDGASYSYVSLDTESGALTWDENLTSSQRSVSVDITISAFGLSSTASVICTQSGAALEYVYYTPVLSFSYPEVGASGGTAVPLLTGTQRRTGNDGSDVNLSLDFATGDFTEVVFSGSSVSGGMIDSSTGVITWAENSSAATRSMQVSVSLSANGVSGAASTTATQVAADLVYTYDAPVFSLSYPSQSAAAGSVSPTLRVTQVRRGNDGSVTTLQIQLSAISSLTYSIASGSGASVTAGSGLLTWTANMDAGSSRSVVVNVSGAVNSVSGSGTATAVQEADAVVSCTDWDVELKLSQLDIDAGAQYVNYTASASRSCTYISGNVVSETAVPDVVSGATWAVVDTGSQRIVVEENTVSSGRYTVITASYGGAAVSLNLMQSGAVTNVNLWCYNNFPQVTNCLISGVLSVPELYDARGSYNSGHITVASLSVTPLDEVGYLNPREETLNFQSIDISCLCNVYTASGSPLQGSYTLWVVAYSSASGNRVEIGNTGNQSTGVVHTIGQQSQDTLRFNNVLTMDQTIEFTINIAFSAQ